MSNRRPLILWSLLVLPLAGCLDEAQTRPPSPSSQPTSRPSAPATGESVTTASLDVFDGILRKHVRDERVDYQAIHAQHREELAGYLAAMAKVDPKTLERDARLAHYINLYNATMVQAVVDRLAPGYSPAKDDFAVFKEALVMTGGKKISLNDLEHKIIRPEFKEPRVHVALVCGARSCPPLLPRAYRAADLDAVLEANMRRFVNDPFRNKIDASNKTAELSQLFNWYKEDFGGAEGVVPYVQKYTEVDLSGIDPTFRDYSWELNIVPPK